MCNYKECNLMKILIQLYSKDIIEFLDTNKVEYSFDTPEHFINIPMDNMSKSLSSKLSNYGLIGEGYIRVRLSSFIYHWIFDYCERNI